MEDSLLLALGVILVALNIRTTKYMHDWWVRSQTDEHPERSWLLQALVSASAVTTAGVCYFLVVTALGIIYGALPVLRPVNTFVLIVVLLQFWRIGREFRQKQRAEELRARHAQLTRKEGLSNDDSLRSRG